MTGILHATRTVRGWLTPKRYRQLALVALLSIAGSGAELASIGAVLPFIAMLTNPAQAATYPVVGPLLREVTRLAGLAPTYTMTIAFGAVVIASAALRIALTRAATQFSHGLGHDVSVRIHDRLLRQDYGFHTAHNTSDLLAGVGKVSTVVGGVVAPVLDMFVATILSSTILVGMLLVDWTIAGIASLLFGAVYLCVSRVSRSMIRRNGATISRSTNERIKTLVESFGGIRDVLLDGSQRHHVTQFTRADDAVRAAQIEISIWREVPRWGIEALGVTIIAALAVAASGRAGGVEAALPSLVAVALAAQRLLPLFQRLYAAWNSVGANHALLDDVARLAELPITLPEAVGDPSQLPFRRTLHLQGVGFRYASGLPWVLRNVTLTLPKGSSVGFAGRTGCGKSTLLDLIMGLLSPAEGVVEVDGVPITSANRHHWKARVAHVPQQIFLADLSIAENIAFGEETGLIDHARVVDAARRARAHEFIEGLPEGYQTLVGERGVRLSGGQRQRLGIARALYRRADVLVLDEATSALDGQTEASVMEGLAQVPGDVTVLIVAHRLTTLAGCDLVVHMEQGGLLRIGRPTAMSAV